MDTQTDELIRRLQERAADPRRRTDARPSVFMQGVRGLDLGGLLSGLAGARADLDRAVAASQSGQVDPEVHAKAEQIAAAMRTPVSPGLPPPAEPAAVAGAEAAIGVALPPVLRRVYAEVADGGVGPGEGLLPLATVVRRHAELRTGAELPRNRTWPETLLPVVDRDPGFDCVDASSGGVVAWDPEGLSERSGEAVFADSFREIAPTVESWLLAWLDEPSPEERLADQLAAANIKAAREARASIAAMTPEERRKMGLPDVGWERVVWGGLGLEDDPPA
jgi:hypothetical protein